MNVEVIKSDLKYKGHIVDVEVDELKVCGKNIVRETVIRGNASAIVAIDEEGKIIFARQYRHSAKTEVLEIPAGMIERDEDPAVAAIRELEEETGYKAKNLQLINCSYTTIGFCTEKIYIYLAQNLEKGVQDFDDDEYIEIEKYTLEETLKMILDGTICDSKTIIGILMYSHMISKK